MERNSPQWSVLIPEERLQDRVRELGRRIARDCRAFQHLHILGILNGAFVFAADLARALRAAGGPPATYGFLRVRTYGQRRKTAVPLTANSAEVDPVPPELAGKDVLVVDDVLDQGITLARLHGILLDSAAVRSVRTCVLLRKELDRADPANAPPRRPSVDYVGFDIPDVWVAGYGLDADDGTLRDLPYIISLPPPMHGKHEPARQGGAAPPARAGSGSRDS